MTDPSRVFIAGEAAGRAKAIREALAAAGLPASGGQADAASLLASAAAAPDSLVVISAAELAALLSAGPATRAGEGSPAEAEDRFRRVADVLHDGVMVVENGRPVYANPRACEIFGYPCEELTGLDGVALAAPEEKERLGRIHADALGGRDFPEVVEYWIVRKDGERRFIHNRVRTWRTGPNVERMVMVTTDMTEQKRIEDRLRESEETFRNLAEQSPNMIFINRKGRIVFANRLCEEQMEMPRSDFYSPGFNFMDLIAPEDRPALLRNFEAHGRGEDIAPYTYNLVTRSGRRIEALIHTKLIMYQKENAILGIITDISELKNAERALRESEERWRAIVEASPMGIYLYRLMDDGRLVFMGANPAADQMLGIAHLPFLGREMEEVFPSLAGTEVPKAYREVCRTGRPWHDEQVDYEDERVRGAFDVHAFRAMPGHIVVMFMDITERIRVEAAARAAREQLNAVLKSVPLPLFAKNRDGRYILFNPAYEAFFGLSAKELVGKTAFECWGTEDAAVYHAKDMELMREAGVQVYEHRLRNVSGEPRDVVFTKACFFDATGATAGLVGTLTDITERKSSEHRIQEQLREKEILLREIHHRVKNNMQVISSLLRLQGAKVDSPVLRAILGEAQERVRSMALVYEKLYASRDLVHIDFRDYLENLTRNVQMAYSLGPKVHLRFSVEDVKLGIDLAVPCGLIVNELVSNVFKHAFPQGWRGEAVCHIGLRRLPDGRIALSVRDNGEGLPEAVDFDTTDSFGLFLVRILVLDQLGGQVQVARKAGTTFRVTFLPPKAGEDRVSKSLQHP